MNNPTSYNQLAGRKLPRIEGLSDGVFAIALTLLVLDLRVPAAELINNESSLLASLYNLLPKLLSYFLSFMTLGIFWTGHTAQFSYIEKSDRNLNWITLFFLMFVSILPFTTAFLSEYITFKLAIAVYWFNILLLGAFVYMHWSYAHSHGFLNVQGEEQERVSRLIRRRVLVAQSLYAAAALLCFINTYLSIGVIILIQLNYAFALFPDTRMPRHHHPQQAGNSENRAAGE